MAAVRRNTRNDDCFGSQRKELIAQGFEFLIRRGLRLIGCIRKETGFGVIGRNECCMGNKLFHGSCHGLIKNRIEFSVVAMAGSTTTLFPPPPKRPMASITTSTWAELAKKPL